jgi:hypothetical protein
MSLLAPTGGKEYTGCQGEAQKIADAAAGWCWGGWLIADDRTLKPQPPRQPHIQAQSLLAVLFATSASVTEATATRRGFRLQPQDAPHLPGRPPTSTIVEVTTWWTSNKTSDQCDGESGKQGERPSAEGA